MSDDSELLGSWNILKGKEDLQILFKLTKKLDAKGIQQIIRIITAIEDVQDNEWMKFNFLDIPLLKGLLDEVMNTFDMRTKISLNLPCSV